MNIFTYFKRSVLSGVCIGLGGAIFVKLGGIFGAIMFAFGLLTVLQYKLPLYTGIFNKKRCVTLYKSYTSRNPFDIFIGKCLWHF